MTMHPLIWPIIAKSTQIAAFYWSNDLFWPIRVNFKVFLSSAHFERGFSLNLVQMMTLADFDLALYWYC